jgi:hypothetical protein
VRILLPMLLLFQVCLLLAGLMILSPWPLLALFLWLHLLHSHGLTWLCLRPLRWFPQFRTLELPPVCHLWFLPRRWGRECRRRWLCLQLRALTRAMLWPNLPNVLLVALVLPRGAKDLFSAQVRSWWSSRST